jgi:hypothetical protein
MTARRWAIVGLLRLRTVGGDLGPGDTMPEMAFAVPRFSTGPSVQAEAREVAHVQYLRHVALPDQRRIGLEQQVVQQHELPK